MKIYFKHFGDTFFLCWTYLIYYVAFSSIIRFDTVRYGIFPLKTGKA